MDLSERLDAVLSCDPDARAIEFEGSWLTWGAVAEAARGCRDLLDAHRVEPGAPVGLVLRNEPALVAALVGVLLGHRCAVTINPHMGDDALAREVDDLRVPVIIASERDWRRPALRDAARRAGVIGIEARIAAEPSVVTSGDPDPGRNFRPSRPGVAVEMLTSGTTGPPKRVSLEYAAFDRAVGAARSHYARGGKDEPGVRLRSGVAIVSAPLVHMSGVFRILLNLCDGRPVALLERFDVAKWTEVVRRHRPKAVSLVPAALAMVLDAHVDPDDLASVRVVTSGTAPLDPALQRTFELNYDVAVLPSYGATEFAGGVAGWTLPLHEEWSERKRGSVGRPQPGREVRIVGDDGVPVDAGVVGTIEVRTAAGPWVRTTDLGSLDADGFLWISGRADDAILRGGFKVFPGEIVEALRAHPAVRDAGATSVADRRLGAVPVAAVEVVRGASVTEAELLDHLRECLVSYQLPVRVVVVDELPRTPSMKVSQPQLREMLAEV